MALTIYEGIKDDRQVDENIDEEILRLLGLEDVSDLDYDEYKTLLKERMAAGRMPGNDIPSEDTERLTEEFKRVKKETGRFKVKNNKIKFDSVVKATKRSRPTSTSTPTKTLMGSDVEPEEKETEVGSEPQDMMGFLTAVVAPSLTKIETSLFNILANLSSQQQAEDKASEKGRVAGQKEKKRDKEEKQESGKGLLDGLGNVGKKVLSPLSGLFSSIFKFLYNIVLGMLALGVLEFLKDPGKIFRDIGNTIIDFFNGFIKSVFDFVFWPMNTFINLINGAVNEFEFAINNTIGKIPGIPDLKLPDIDNIEAPQIPKIKPPPEKTEKPKDPAAKVDVPAMTGGGEITNVTNKYYQLMEGGGKVKSDSGEKVTGAGPDTQLVALQPGEVVMSKPAVDTYGTDTLLGMNAAAGGTNSPKMAKVRSASGGGLISAMQGGGMVGGGANKYSSLLSFISKGEGGYNSMNQGTQGDTIVGSTHNASTKVGKNLTSMTIGEVMERQSYLMNPNNPQVSDYGIFAAGRYQIIPSTMSEILPQSGLSKDDMFSKQNQDKLGITLITKKQPRVGDYINGNGTIDGAMDALSNEFASMPDPKTGNSKYGGGNRALHTVEEVKQALIQAKTGGGSVDQSQSQSTPGQSSSSKPFTFSPIAEMEGTPGIGNQPTGFSTEDLTVPSMTPGSSSLPVVSPKVKPSSRSNIQPPKSRTGSGGIIPVAIPGQQQPTSSSGGNQTDAPMFPSTDQNNPELLVVKSIYNIVG